MINKLLLLGLSLFFSFTGYTQLVSLEQPELMVLYRGYPNRVFVNISEDADVSVNDIEVQCANCAISKVNKPGGYIVKPGAGKIAYIRSQKTLKIYSKNIKFFLLVCADTSNFTAVLLLTSADFC